MKTVSRLNTVPVSKLRRVEQNENIQVGDFLQFLTLEDYENIDEEITELVEKFAGEMVEVVSVSKDTNEHYEHTYLVVNKDGDMVSATDHEFYLSAYREKE